MSWVLNFFYALLLIVLSPVLLYRVLILGKYRQGWAEKFLGQVPRRTSTKNCIWFHAVSVGEVLQLQTVIQEFAKTQPDWEIWITTTTHTGHAVAVEKFPDHHVSYFPLDFSWAVKNAIHRIQPKLVVLVELELWPNFIRTVDRANIPLALINGRISEKSFRGYQKVRWLMRSLLRRFDLLAVQSETYAERLTDLGGNAETIHVTGSIKFDGLKPTRDNPQTQELRQSFGIENHERIFIAGSTQDPEEQIALETYEALRSEHPDLRLVLVPRHQERFGEVARLIEQRGLPLLRRSSITQNGPVNSPPQTDRKPVLLLDTLGELSACWGLAEIAFVGGSLTNRGGQNMIEPSAYGAGVLFGPNTKNFRQVVEMLLDQNAAQVVANAVEFQALVRHWLAHPEEAAACGQRAKALVLSQQGATTKTVALLNQVALSRLDSGFQSASDFRIAS